MARPHAARPRRPATIQAPSRAPIGQPPRHVIRPPSSPLNAAILIKHPHGPRTDRARAHSGHAAPSGFHIKTTTGKRHHVSTNDTAHPPLHPGETGSRRTRSEMEHTMGNAAHLRFRPRRFARRSSISRRFSGGIATTMWNGRKAARGVAMRAPAPRTTRWLHPCPCCSACSRRSCRSPRKSAGHGGKRDRSIVRRGPTPHRCGCSPERMRTRTVR